MTKIILGKEKMSELYEDDVFEGCNFEHEGETYKYVEESGSEMDDNGRYDTFIYQRKSDEKFFTVDVIYARYGYEDYGYEDWLNDGEMYEVEKKEQVMVSWVKV